MCDLLLPPGIKGLNFIMEGNALSLKIYKWFKQKEMRLFSIYQFSFKNDGILQHLFKIIHIKISATCFSVKLVYYTQGN